MPSDESTGGHRAGGAIFVYYKVPREEAGELQQAFGRVRAEFQKAAGDPYPSSPCFRRVELMHRSHDGGSAAPRSGDLETWMEIYWFDRRPEVDSGSNPSAPRDLAALQGVIEQCARAAGIVDLVDGARHYEAFDACA